MSSRTRSIRTPGRERHRSQRSRRRDEDEDEIPEVYREMLAEAEAREARAGGESGNERPSKRFKPAGSRATLSRTQVAAQETQYSVENEPPAGRKPQTVYNSPSESSEDSDMEWEEVDIQQPSSHPILPGPVAAADDAPLQIILDRQEGQRQKSTRQKPVTGAEKRLRLDVHKMHLLCLLCHVQRRNLWCNDEEVQGFLKKMLPKPIVSLLNPSENKPQHARSTSFIDGLNQAGEAFIKRFKVTKPGLRRAHWAYDSASLKQKAEAIVSEAEVFLSRDDFRAQAKTLQGSRDFGAQLFCALLRSVAVEARLVCSLQPLPFSGTRRDMICAKPVSQPIIISSDDLEISTDDKGKAGSSPRASRIRRLGQPGFKPARFQSSRAARPPIFRESPHPVFWVEAFNEAVHKWIVIDPMVTKSLAKPSKFEPPAADPYNCMNYVVAFEEDASARDVTRRYAKAFNAKTRKLRVECTKSGEVWWSRVLRFYEKPFLEDRDELEIGELTAKTAAEPMPRNVQDFKDHPIYALERHLRRNEAIFPQRVIGHVSLGKSGSKNQATEPIYRRSDVHTLRSANKWYRLGRDVKLGEQALKRIPASKNRTTGISDEEEDAELAMETPLYAFYQTEVYQPPPVVHGKVPKNAYGNLDVYVPSMVPPGGVHIPHFNAAHAARILGIDYADAVTGFNFKGRHGTAVFQGVVVADEFRAAVQEVLNCMEEERLHNELEQRSAEVLHLWKHFLLKLRIAERVKTYAVEGEEADDESSVGLEMKDAEMEGGGFLPESGPEIVSPPIPTSAPPLFESPVIDYNNPVPLEDAVEDSGGGGFLLESDAEPEKAVNHQNASHKPNVAPPRYNLVVVDENERPRDIIIPIDSDGDVTRPHTPKVGLQIEPFGDSGGSLEAPITVDSSVNADSASASVELLSQAPEVLSQQSLSNEEEEENSLLSEDPDDEDAVPEWLMSD
ncbi:hypothetical protein AOCH_000552 [Aspergillus ochraceoroseus]|uniref:DNA repair protein n=2 Tax=Aspergillus ochraceoroseus TaxID=138278 RepID=A0A0F8WUN5_9EURO|nr:hypothetical protein AOCH_000552 [Aspergillus ochraceoroseus]